VKDVITKTQYLNIIPGTRRRPSFATRQLNYIRTCLEIEFIYRQSLLYTIGYLETEAFNLFYRFLPDFY